MKREKGKRKHTKPYSHKLKAMHSIDMLHVPNFEYVATFDNNVKHVH